jgi:hypothetical protein
MLAMSDNSARSATTRRADWLVVARAEPGYAESVVMDMSRIGGTGSGRALLERIRDSGHSVTIQKPDPIDPPNAWVRPQDRHAAGGSDCVVVYDPRQWPNPAQLGVPSSDVLLFAILHQAVGQLVGTANLLREQAGETVAMDSEALADYRRERDNG